MNSFWRNKNSAPNDATNDHHNAPKQTNSRFQRDFVDFRFVSRISGFVRFRPNFFRRRFINGTQGFLLFSHDCGMKFEFKKKKFQAVLERKKNANDQSKILTKKKSQTTNWNKKKRKRPIEIFLISTEAAKEHKYINKYISGPSSSSSGKNSRKFNERTNLRIFFNVQEERVGTRVCSIKIDAYLFFTFSNILRQCAPLAIKHSK